MPTAERPRLVAEPRTELRKKSALRVLRRSGQVPASLFGHGDPQPIQVPERALRDFLRQNSQGVILDVDLDGRVSPAVIRELERDVVSGHILHLALQRVNMREQLKMTVPVLFVGEEEVMDRRLVVERQLTELEIVGEAALLPDSITVDLSGLEAGATIRVADLALPEGVSAIKDAELPVASITLPAMVVEPEEEAAAAEIPAEVAEGKTAAGEG